MRIAFCFNVKHSLTDGDKSEIDFDFPETIDAIAKTIESLGHEVIRIEADLSAYENLKAQKDSIDLVFNIAEGLGGDARESQIPIFCEILGIPYTHSSPTTHAIKLNKSLAKLLLAGAGVRVPRSVIAKKGEEIVPKHDLSYPLILKPNSEGSSMGVFNDNVVENEEELKKQLHVLRDKGVDGDLLIEEYIDGREFTVAVMGNEDPVVLPIIEQKFDFLPEGMRKIAGYELKWIYEDKLKDLTTAYDCPAKLKPEQTKEVEEVSKKVYTTLNVACCARIDYRMDRNENLYFIEINTLPGINPDESGISYFPLAARTAGMSYKDLVGKIIEYAIKKQR